PTEVFIGAHGWLFRWFAELLQKTLKFSATLLDLFWGTVVSHVTRQETLEPLTREGLGQVRVVKVKEFATQSCLVPALLGKGHFLNLLLGLLEGEISLWRGTAILLLRTPTV